MGALQRHPPTFSHLFALFGSLLPMLTLQEISLEQHYVLPHLWKLVTHPQRISNVITQAE